MTLDIANAGKHVVCEKPLCMTLEEADLMVETCKEQGVLFMYAEELYFTPKYVKAKEMADQGAFGDVYLVKQSEKHFGPHAPWFWDVDQAGGGVFMDMGCHGIAFCYWFLDRPKIKSITTQMGTYVHGEITKGEDNTFCIIEFENGAVGMVEDSWARHGGMDDRIEVFGDYRHSVSQATATQ
jgi:predicted dehydrogenase